MVIGNNHVHAPLIRQRHWIDGANAAIHRDEQRDALRRHCFDGGVRDPVAVGNPVR